MTTDVRRHVSRVVRNWVADSLGGRVAGLRLTRSAYASSAMLLNVHVRLDGGERVRAVYKEIPAAPGVKPEFIADPSREAWIYESVLATDGAADAPRLLASGRGDRGGHWLLLEWVGSVDLGQVGSLAVWREAASRLARLHVWGESCVDGMPARSLVRWGDPGLHDLWARRARRPDDGLDLLWLRYDVVAEHLGAMPRTLVHGDLNASNVLVTRSAEGRRVRVIDWETAGVGPGLLDLASLVSGRLPERHREQIVDAYRAGLAGSRLDALSDDEFDEDLRWCRLAQAVRWLGWSPGWSAPAQHQHDWRQEASVLAGELGLLERS